MFSNWDISNLSFAAFLQCFDCIILTLFRLQGFYIVLTIAGLPPDQNGKNNQMSPGLVVAARKRVKRVSKAEFESILAKRVRKELEENCDLVKLQETCRELQEEVNRWKARTERLTSECAHLEKLVNSPPTSEKVKGNGREAVISKKEEESLPPLPARIPPNDSLPTPVLKLTQTELGLEVQWTFEGDQSSVASYELFAFRKLTLKSSSLPLTNVSWKKVGDVKSIPLPMKCTLSQFKVGSTYSFAVRSKDTVGGVGQFSDVKIISLT